MHAVINSWVQSCEMGKTADVPYVEPSPIQGSLVANNPLDMVCMNFTKMDPSRNGKENVLVIINWSLNLWLP